ncbi:MAG: zinc ribbon domain-containing protein, partial [Candidatus Methanoplasma sp.]|nr:zinc ribbon domain-containing protein [Candidatus Methanoplasma sp.]
MTERENYCRLVGLNPMKESAYTAADIEKKIAARETKWKSESTNPQNDPEKRYAADQKVKAVPDIRKVMADPILRSREFDSGLKLLRSKAARLNRDSVILHDGSKVLLPGVANGLAKKLQWDGVTEDDLIRLSGIRAAHAKAPVSDKVLTAFKALRGVHSFTPSELLNELIDNKALEINTGRLADGASLTQIRSVFDQCEKRVGNVKRDILPNQDSYIQALRAIKTILGSDQDLSSLLKYGQCMRLLESAKETMDDDYTGQPFSREYIDGVLNRCLRNSTADRSMAVSILEEYCVKKKHLANFSLKDSRLTECLECGAVIEIGDNIMHCSVCGCSIRTKCPQCGTSQSSNNGSCVKCGFDFKNGLQKAKDLERKFRSALSYGMVDEATECIAKIENAYSTYPTIDAMRGDLKPVAAKYGDLLKQIDMLYKLRRYYTLKSRIDDSKGDFPKLLNILEIERKYEEASSKVEGADRFCERAKIVDSQSAMPMYVSAMETCPDHPRAKAKLRENPPESPADASVRIVDGKPTVKFAVPAERTGMTFCVYRDRESVPSVTDDTPPLAEIPGCVFQDKFPEPGADLYYAVHSKRWGILSREAAFCGPVTVFTEVEHVTIEPIDGGLRIEYAKPKGCSRVRIWRKEGTTAAGSGEEVEVLHDGDGVIDDYGLKGG